MSAPHTPSPWSLGETKIAVAVGGYTVHAIPLSGEGTAIGCVYAGTVGRPRSVDVEYANAALIAAAPDLLGALDDLVMLAAQHRGNAVRESVQRARAALAKARGVSP